MSIMTVVIGLIFGGIIGGISEKMGIDMSQFTGGVKFLIGFGVGALMMLILWGLFTLIVLAISKKFGNKSNKFQ